VQNLDYPITHIQINIINKNKLKRLEIHREIYQKLNLVIEKGLHSIEIKILNT
jgi:stress-induced morphogen